MTVFPIEPKHMVSYSKRTNSLIQEKFCKKNAFQCFIMQFKLQINHNKSYLQPKKVFSHNRLTYWGDGKNRNFTKGNVTLTQLKPERSSFITSYKLLWISKTCVSTR